MDDPSIIPLKSDLPFHAGSREVVLAIWEHTVAKSSIEIRRPEKVKKVVINGEEFTVQTDKTTCHGRNVVLSIRVQGIFQVPREHYPHVSSHLVDPALYHYLDIVVVGAGEAAIEEAIASLYSACTKIAGPAPDASIITETVDRFFQHIEHSKSFNLIQFDANMAELHSHLLKITLSKNTTAPAS